MRASFSKLTGAQALLTLYVVMLLGLGVRALLPKHWDIGLLGRDIGGWSMYGSEVSDLKIVAKTNGKKLRTEGFWHARFVHSSTPRLHLDLVARYAAWLHDRHDLPPTQSVTVEVRHRVDRGLSHRIKVKYP